MTPVTRDSASDQFPNSTRKAACVSLMDRWRPVYLLSPCSCEIGSNDSFREPSPGPMTGCCLWSFSGRPIVEGAESITRQLRATSGTLHSETYIYFHSHLRPDRVGAILEFLPFHS